MHICNFDNDATAEIPKRHGPSHDIAVLKSSSKVSIFWVTETQARAKRIERWEKQGLINLHSNTYGYPWFAVSVSDSFVEKHG